MRLPEIFCFGTDKYEFIPDMRLPYTTVFPPSRRRPQQYSDHAVKIFNEKTGEWEYYPCNETIIECPVCGRLMKVYYIPGTTWLATCSLECNIELVMKEKELGSLAKALDYFAKERRKRNSKRS